MFARMQATGEDYNVEEGEGKRPFRALLDVGLVRTTTGNRVFGALKVSILDDSLRRLLPLLSFRFTFTNTSKEIDSE